MKAQIYCPPDDDADAVALVFAASSQGLVDEFSGRGRSPVPRAVIDNVTAWRKLAMPYGAVLVYDGGRGRVIGAADVQALCVSLETVFALLRGRTCCWIIDESLKSAVEPLLLAHANSQEGHA